MARDRFADTHVDDGMRHGGLVPSAQEREEERAIRAARSTLAQKVIEATSSTVISHVAGCGDAIHCDCGAQVTRNELTTALRDLFRSEGIELSENNR